MSQMSISSNEVWFIYLNLVTVIAYQKAERESRSLSLWEVSRQELRHHTDVKTIGAILLRVSWVSLIRLKIFNCATTYLKSFWQTCALSFLVLKKNPLISAGLEAANFGSWRQDFTMRKPRLMFDKICKVKEYFSLICKW